jgi:hypothetical protein
MDRQVHALRRATGQDVALVGESEGPLVMKYHLLAHPRAPVDESGLLSPILEPARVAYPAAGHGGFGVATRFALERVGDLISAVLFDVDPELVAALAEPPPLPAEIPVAMLPALHGSISGAGRVRDAVVVRLSGGRVPRFPRWEVTAEVVRGAAAAWQVPTLPLGLVPKRAGVADACGASP